VRLHPEWAESGLDLGYHLSLRTAEDWPYLAIVLDLFNREVVG